MIEPFGVIRKALHIILIGIACNESMDYMSPMVEEIFGVIETLTSPVV